MATSDSPILRYRWVILSVCWLAYVVSYAQRLTIGPLAPFLREELSLTNTEIGSLVSAAALGYTITLIPAGWLADRVGVRWVLSLGEIGAGIFVIAMFFISSFTAGLVYMFVAGMGLGFVMPTTTKAIVVWFPLKERATAMGFKQTSVNIAGVITGATLPPLALAAGWRYGFLIIGIIAILIGIVSFFLYREPEPTAVVSTPRPASAGVKETARDVFRSRDIWLLSLAGLGMGMVEFTVAAYFVLYLKDSLLFGVVAAGFLLALFQAGGAFGKPISGVLSDRLFHGGRKKVYALICFITFLSCVAFAFLKPGSSYWLLLPLTLVGGLAAIGWAGLHLTLVGEIAGRELAGTVTGMSTVIVQIGVVAGPPLFGYIIDTTGSYPLGWQVLAVCAAVAAVAVLLVREEKRRV